MLAFIDETGNENLISIDPYFPLFGLGALLISKSEYKKLLKLGTSKFAGNIIRKVTKLSINNKKDNIIGLQIIDIVLSVLGRKYLGKPEKESGNNISLKRVENKIKEATLVLLKK